MNAATTYRNQLAWAADALTAHDDPDGLAMRRALLVAANAGVDSAGSADWDLFTVAITQAVQDLQSDLADPVILTGATPGAGPDNIEVRREVVNLVRRLADRYAAAAAGDSGSPWRRLIWAQVAHRLDDAVAELT